jgi:hypothetical protein
MRWIPENKSTGNVLLQNPTANYIIKQQNKGLPRSLIVDNLVKSGYQTDEIRKIFMELEKSKKNNKLMDWRSPTAINQTARMIRNDIRNKKISYSLGMTILIKARNTLKTMILNPRKDNRLGQINQEIRITKKLLMPKFSNYNSMMNYKVRH